MAQSILQGRVGILLAKIESTYGTDPTPVVGSNAVLVTEFTMKPMQAMNDKRRLGPSFSSYGWAPGSRMCEYSITCPLIGGGDPGGGALAEPHFSALLQAAGMGLASTGSPVDTHTYTPDSTSAQVSVTLYLYVFVDGHANCELFEANGCVHNAKINATAGEPVTITFEGKGLFVKPVSVSAASAPTYTHPKDSMVAKNATLTFGGTARVVRDFELDLGMEPTERPSIGSGVDGYAGFYLSRDLGGSITGNFTVEMELQSSYDRWAAVDAGTEAAFVLTLDSADGDRANITASGLQLGSPEPDFTPGVNTYKQPFALIQQTDAGDDALSIAISRTP